MPKSIVLTDNIKRDIGQHFIFGFHGQEVSDDIKRLIRDYHIGNVIIMKRNVKSITQLHALIQKLQRIAKDAGHAQPLMIGIDQENGLVSAFSPSKEAGTQFPGAMALAATSSVDIAERVSAASGREMRMAGINWAFSPVADVNSDARNPVIGVRSFGDNAHDVGRFSVAVAKGLTSSAIAPCAKHFPGHGDTYVDSHLDLPQIIKSRDGPQGLLRNELVPFRALVTANVATIMTGHMALPLITGGDTPCSLSSTVTTNLLRIELGFSGVVVSDCLEMAAVEAKYGCEGGAVEALQAGADVAMICHTMEHQRGAVEAVYKAVRSGLFAMDYFQESTLRIRDLKSRFAGSWESVLLSKIDPSEVSKLKEENKIISKESYEASISWISNGHLFKPLAPDSSVLLLTPRMESLNPAVDDAENIIRTADGKLRNTAGPSYISFASSVKNRASSSTHVVYSPSDGNTDNDTDELFSKTIPSVDSVIFTTRNAWGSSIWQIEYLKNVLAACNLGTKVILVASCAPYDILSLGPSGIELEIPCLCTFEFTPPALETAAAVLFGETQAIGKSPVM